jgi:hypothetical protein
MRYFKVLTLVDITETKQYRKEQGKELEKDQQQNFVTLLQTIGIRVNPFYESGPKLVDHITDQMFGTQHVKTTNVWQFEFGIEYEGGLTDSAGNPAGLLIDDLHLVPVITNLTESARLDPPIFDTKTNSNRNTVIVPI